MSDETVTQQQRYIERWEHALAVLLGMTEHERTKHFDMDSWGYVNQCGTVACLAGHCSLNPWFREHGFSSQIKNRWLEFTESQPMPFFGKGGYQDVFLATRERYAQVVELVRGHIEYLKGGGDPETPRYERSEDYYDCDRNDDDE